MNKILERLETYTLYALVFLLPIVVLPISLNPFVVPKLSVLSYGVGLVLLLRAARTISSGKLDFAVGSYDFPVLLLVASYIASTVLRTPNKMEALLLPGVATAVIFGALAYFLINQVKDREKSNIASLLFYSGVVFSLVVLLATAGVFARIPQLPVYAKDSNFNPEGGVLPAAIFLTTLVPLGVGMVLRESKTQKKAFKSVALIVLIFGLILSIFKALPGKPTTPRFPSFATSWAVAIDALKESPVFGVGPGNYLTAFNRFRPLDYNATDLWAIRYATASDYFLTALTEVGLLGAAGLILLLLSFYRVGRHALAGNVATSAFNPQGPAQRFAANSSLISLGTLIVLLAFFPATVLLLAIVFILLSFASTTRKTTLNLSTQATSAENAPTGQVSQGVASRLPAILVTAPVIVLVVLFGYRASRALAAEAKFKRALDALARNEAATTYDTLREAINLNPLVDRYHATYAQVNLALANSIALRAGGPQGPEAQTQEEAPQITDQDRANIAQLVQQAIREAKATVALNPLRAGNWELLARIYQALIPFAQGADAFAVQSFRQAVALDPINPNLRIALGVIHYAMGDFDTAIRVLELATVVKPDHANAHYNLAFALREDGKIDRAISEMTLVLSLVDPGTQDYETTRAALTDLEARRAAATPPAGEELTPPQPAEEAVLEPPLELPEEAEPPEAPLTPTPTPEEGSTPAASPEPTPTP